MKMPIADYEEFVSLIRPMDTPERRAKYIAGNFSNAVHCRDKDQRYRWDCMWAATYTLESTRLAVVRICAMLADKHIDTALRKFIPPLVDDDAVQQQV